MTLQRGLKVIWIPKRAMRLNDSFETIATEKDNPIRREFETGQLGNDELKEDELTLKSTKVISLFRNCPVIILNPVQF